MFCTGSAPIDGIFVTPGIDCINAFLLPHLEGVGDHRCFIMDLSLEFVIELSFTNII